MIEISYYTLIDYSQFFFYTQAHKCQSKDKHTLYTFKTRGSHLFIERIYTYLYTTNYLEKYNKNHTNGKQQRKTPGFFLGIIARVLYDFVVL